MPKITKVGVVGPFYRGEEHAEAWVEGMSRQDYAEFKLYIVDDASPDQTVVTLKSALARRNLAHTLLPLKTNVGPSAARNVAIRAALEEGCDLILLLDEDCRVTSDWLRRHVQFHEAHPEFAVLGGAIEGRAHSIVGQADGFCSWFTAVPHSKSGEVTWMHLSTTNMSIRAEAFSRVGFFDEELATGEDVAFCRRLKKAGLRLWFQSDIIITHLDRDRIPEARRHHYRWGLHSYTLSAQSHGGYYGFLKKLKAKWPAACLVPVIAALNVVLILKQYTPRAPRVWLYLPWIAYLKWWNAKGVYQGFVNPELCRRS